MSKFYTTSNGRWGYLNINLYLRDKYRYLNIFNIIKIVKFKTLILESIQIFVSLVDKVVHHNGIP